MRLRFSPSTGEVRLPATTAWTLLAGIRISRPAIVARVEIADQLGDGDRALVFVAVVAALQDHRGTGSIGDHGDGQAGHAPGVVVRGVGDHDEPDLLAGLVEVDRGEGGGFGLGVVMGVLSPRNGWTRKGERQGKMPQAAGH